MSNRNWLHIAFWQRSKLVNRIKKKARSLKTDFPETWKGFQERKFNFSWGSLEQQRNCRFADVVKSFTNTAVCALLVILYKKKLGKNIGKLVDIGHYTSHSSWRNYNTLSKVLNPFWSVICHFAVMKFHS